MELEKLQNKLIRAISKAGLSWASYSSIIEISNEINGQPFPPGGLAVWVYDRVTKNEKVLIPTFTLEKFNVEELVFIIKHELLHKALFRNTKETSNLSLLNAALDACVNKVLYLGNRAAFINLCKKIYIQGRISPTCLANASITSAERELLPDNLRKLFDPIYYYENHNECAGDNVTNKCYNTDIPDPMVLYNSLANSLSSEQKSQIKQNNPASEQSSLGNNTNKEDPHEGPSGAQGEDVEPDEESDPAGKEKPQDEPANEPETDANDGGDSQEVPEDENSQNSAGNTSDYNDENEDNEESDSSSEEQEDNTPEDDDNPGKRYDIRGGKNRTRDNSKQTVKQEQEFTDNIQYSDGNNYSARRNLAAIFEKYVINPDKANTEGLKDFIDSFETMKQVEGAEVCIYSQIASSVRFDPYPNNLTRTGIEFIALGVSGPDDVPLYLNDSDKRTCKKNICVYVDTSPSMRNAMPYVFHIIEFFEGLEECEYTGGLSNGKYVFSEKVQECDDKQWEDLKKGSFYGGYGTSFEAVGQHILNNLSQDQCDICMIMTDGQSRINAPTIEKLNETGIKVYRMYFSERGRYSYKDEVTSSLDQLNGTSFTIPYSGGK